MGRNVKVPRSPSRIISLVPSQTELLHDLGLDSEVVGLTKFCVHPDHWRKTKSVVGGTKKFRFDTIDGLKPDLIIANKEENYEEGIRELAGKYPVWISDIYDLNDARDMITSISSIVGREKKGREILDKIQEDFSVKVEPIGTALYFIWNEPYMAAGTDTFINDMMYRAGFFNVLPKGSRYPELTSEEITKLDPDYIFLSSEPYPFKEKHLQELQNICPNSKVMLVDGEIFSWYGSRLLKAHEYFETIKEGEAPAASPRVT